MNDLIALIIPNIKKKEEVLLIDMYEDVNILLNKEKETKIAFMDKLTAINFIYKDKMASDNTKSCLFFPFCIAKHLKFEDSSTLAKDMLTKISKILPSVNGHKLLSTRYILHPHVNYKFVVFLTDPINPDELKLSKTFWCNKNILEKVSDGDNYFILGDEIDQILKKQISRNFDTDDDSRTHEYRFTPYNSSVHFGFLKNISLHQKIIIQSNCDSLVQNYIFADFLMNSYPCTVMSFPQFLGFAIARGIYMRRCKQLFTVLKDNSDRNMSFDNFLFGCICMDLSSPHEGDLRVARGNLIFKYYDNNKDNTLDFSELRCLVKRMRKKMDLDKNDAEVSADTDIIMKLLNKDPKLKSIRHAKISLRDFQEGLHLPELKGLTHLLRFSVSYLMKTRSLMEMYVQSIEAKNMKPRDLTPIDQNLILIPFFIKEAYSKEELFKSMIYYSTNYGTIQLLLDKIDERNRLAIMKHKFSTVFSLFFHQVFYYLSEIAFDVYNSEILFPLRNPIFLIVIFTAIAIVDPDLFHTSALFWNNLLSFILFNLPALIYALRNSGQWGHGSENRDLHIDHSQHHWSNKLREYDKRRELLKDSSRLTIFERWSENRKLIGKYFSIQNMKESVKGESQRDSSEKIVKEDKCELKKPTRIKNVTEKCRERQKIIEKESKEMPKCEFKKYRRKKSEDVKEEERIVRDSKSEAEIFPRQQNVLVEDPDTRENGPVEICKVKSSDGYKPTVLKANEGESCVKGKSRGICDKTDENYRCRRKFGRRRNI